MAEAGGLPEQAQRGHFLVGGLNRRYGSRSYRIDGSNVSAEQFPDISTLGVNVNFPNSSKGQPNTHWSATGWTVSVDAAWNPNCCNVLQEKAFTTTPYTRPSVKSAASL
ncbi:hypothetical protein OIA45_40680 (plasmid) [Streptomyces chartreusis]|uniref:hypothetical protein n=1 Tax=Streptomyces chartreusis TaxID=1969 RepID=UPI002F90BC31|nr:hypothetical protein OIA45_40680 [Streptomyces chartreusis]